MNKVKALSIYYICLSVLVSGLSFSIYQPKAFAGTEGLAALGARAELENAQIINPQSGKVEPGSVTLTTSFVGESKAAQEVAATHAADVLSAAVQESSDTGLTVLSGEKGRGRKLVDKFAEKVLGRFIANRKAKGGELKVNNVKFSSEFTRKVEKAKDLMSELKAKRPVGYTIARFILNSGLTITSVIVFSHYTPIAGIVTGLVTGSLSAAVMFLNVEFMEWIEGKKEVREARLKRKYGKLRVEAVNFTKLFALEVALYSIVKGSGFLAGVGPKSFFTEAGMIVMGSFFATLTQGVWDRANSMERAAVIGDSKDERLVETAEKRSSKLAFGASIASIFAGILTTAGGPGAYIGGFAFVALGLSGVVYLGKTHMRIKDGTIKDHFKRYMSATKSCHSVFAF